MAKNRQNVVTLGVFDGIHRGHRSLFSRVIRRAQRVGGTAVVYTFDPHPAAVLVPESCPPMIMTLQQRVRAIQDLGIRKVVVQKFTRRFSRLSPEAFFRRVMIGRLRASEIFVGYNFTFGFHRSGTAEHLDRFGRQTGIPVHVIDPYLWRETLASSTQIRQLLTRGQLRPANELLGRRYSMEGRVIRGRGIGGRELGIHTANLKPENDQILPTGVYATYAWTGGRRFRSVTNIGPNPTFGPGPLSVETHLLDFSRSILGKEIRVEFVEKLREEIAFASPGDLARQIHNDIRTARTHLK